MEYIYSAMLLFSAKKDINEANLKKVLEAAGVKVEEGRVKALVSALEGVDIKEAIKEAVMAPVAAAPVASAPQASSAPQAKKEEKKSEDEAAASLSSLFG